MIKKLVSFVLFFLSFSLGLQAQITVENAQNYVGKTLYFNPHKPWYESYMINNTLIGNLRTHGVRIQNIIVQNNKITVILQDMQTGTLKPITSLNGEIALHHVSTEPYSEEKNSTENTASNDNLSLHAHDYFLNVFAGKAITPQKIDDAKWADGGFNGGLQLLTALLPYFALGVEFSANGFSGAETEESGQIFGITGYTYHSGPGYSYTTTDYGYIPYSSRLKVNANSFQFMLAGRITLNPQDDFRLYLPLGIGIQNTRVKYDLQFNMKNANFYSSGSKKYSSTAYYIGVGLEKELEGNDLIGLEARYHSFSFKQDDWNISAHPYYYTIAIKIGHKF